MTAWPLLAACLTLLAGCGRGPKVNYCVTGTPEVLGCARTPPIPYAQADRFRCLSPNDQERLLRACRMGVGAPELNYCVIYAKEGAPIAVCGDGTYWAPAELQNFACLSEMDSERLLIWCRRKKPET